MSANWATIKVGDSAFFDVTITEGMVAAFTQITGDDNALHADEAFAKRKGFSKKVAHGMLLSSFFSTVVGKYFLGDDNLYLSQTLEFRKPVLVGDSIAVRGTVTEKIESTKMLRIETVIELNGAVAVRGEAQVKHNG